MTNRFDVHYQSGATNRDSGERGTFPKSGGSLPFAPPPSLSEKSNTTSVQHIYQTAVTKVAGDRVVLNNLRSERIRCVNNSFVLVDFPSPSTSVPLCYSFIHSSRSFFSSFSSHSLLIILLCFLAYRAVLFSFFPPLFRVLRILFLLLLLLFFLLLLLLLLLFIITPFFSPPSTTTKTQPQQYSSSQQMSSIKSSRHTCWHRYRRFTPRV